MSPVGRENDHCRDHFRPSGELSYMSICMHECRSNEHIFGSQRVGLREFLNRAILDILFSVDAAPALPRRVSSFYRSS